MTSSSPRRAAMPGSPGYSRRALLRLGAGAVIGASQFGSRATAQEAPPRGAAHHRLSLGSRELLVLSDGHLVVPPGMLAANVPQAELHSFLGARAVGLDRVHFHINVALVKTGNDYILIDAGSGGTWEPTAGKLAESLEAAGVNPAQITKVVLTHAHPDHIWGLIDELDDSLRFPNAHYVIAAREFDFWTSGEAARLAGPIEGIAAGARRVLKAIEARTTRIRPGEEVAPGLLAIDTPGHTPGHISVVVAAGPDRLLVTADAVQNAHVSLAHPDWQPRADMDGDRAARSRRRVLEMAAGEKLRVLCYHIPFPGLGRVERSGSAFTWVPDS
jgi:glyoxylase-like metal-dependent hydrolase (beta-lactamase superfamily II)